MSARIGWWLAVWAVPAVAVAGGGGGGVMLNGSLYPLHEDSSDYDAPGLLGCVGGVGYGFTDGGLRVGGEGLGCRGRPGVRMMLGGAQLGYEHGRRSFWWSLHSGVGVGTLLDRTQVSGDYQSLFVYLRPEFTVGFDLGWTAMEVGVHALTPINVVQWVGEDGDGRGYVHPTAGLQMSFLFGSFQHGPRWTPPAASPGQVAVPLPPDYPPPPAVPPAEPPPDDAPLAIPADEAGYPPPPPPR